jgi:hypothetical protein
MKFKKEILMKSKIVLALSLLTATTSWAGPFVSEGPGPVATYANCEGRLENGTDVTFEVRATAVPTIIDAVLIEKASNQLISHMYCEKGAPSHRNVPSVTWSCYDSPALSKGRYLMSVELSAGGFTGITTGTIKAEQIYPLPPQVIGSIVCK